MFGALTYIPMGLPHSPWIAGAAFSLGAGAGWNISSMSIRQTVIPTHMFGRVQGGYRTAIWA